jgi:hypothetical protein
MRQTATIIIAFFYICTASGINVHYHYCMGKLADWGLDHDNSKTCGGCGMEKSSEKDNGCCKDEQKFIKNTTDQKIVESSIQFTGIFGIAIVPDYPELPSIKISSLTEAPPLSHAPPRSSGVAVYILNRTFLI